MQWWETEAYCKQGAGRQGARGTEQHIEAACGWAVGWTTHVASQDSSLESAHSSH